VLGIQQLAVRMRSLFESSPETAVRSFYHANTDSSALHKVGAVRQRSEQLNEGADIEARVLVRGSPSSMSFPILHLG